MIRNGCSPHEYYAEAPKSFFGCCLPIDKYRNIQIVNIWRLLILVHCVWRVRWTCRICDMRYASLIHKAIECVIFPFSLHSLPVFFFVVAQSPLPNQCYAIWSTFLKSQRFSTCIMGSLTWQKLTEKKSAWINHWCREKCHKYGWSHTFCSKLVLWWLWINCD